MLRVIAPAKVNLMLGVGGVRADGYHAVTTVLHCLELADELTLRPASSLSLTCDTDLGIPADKNLALRAARAMGEAFGRAPGVEITLVKHIPHGAGLGGGSTDAAGVIAALAMLWGADRRDARCLRVAASLGADIPFFLCTSGAALMTGRGDELSRELPGLGGAAVALVRPRMPVPTAEAYRAFDLEPMPAGDPESMMEALGSRDAALVAGSLVNNLERASVSVVPEVGDALAWTRVRPGVLGASVAGSGSAVFALCDGDEAARAAAGAAEGLRGWWARATRLSATGVVVTEGEDDE